MATRHRFAGAGPDVLFEPLGANAPDPQTTDVIIAGQDARLRYAPVALGSPIASNTRMISKGRDWRNYFAAAGTVGPPVPPDGIVGPGDPGFWGGAGFHVFVRVVASPGRHAALWAEFYADGRWGGNVDGSLSRPASGIRRLQRPAWGADSRFASTHRRQCRRCAQWRSTGCLAAIDADAIRGLQRWHFQRVCLGRCVDPRSREPGHPGKRHRNRTPQPHLRIPSRCPDTYCFDPKRDRT
jgi:hypothetical protein